MKWLTEDAVIVCKHELGNVQVRHEPDARRRSGGRIVLVEPDPEGRSIRGCPNIGVSIKPCQHTLRVKRRLLDVRPHRRPAGRARPPRAASPTAPRRASSSTRSATPVRRIVAAVVDERRRDDPLPPPRRATARASRPGSACRPAAAWRSSAGDEAVRQSILLLLSTIPGERVMRPTYGCHLHRLVFWPNDDTTAGLAIHYVRRAVERFEPRVEVIRVDATRDADAA